MRIKEKFNGFKKRLRSKYMYSIVVVAIVLVAIAFGAMGMYQYSKANEYRRQLDNQYNRAFSETVDYVRDINSMLVKSMLVSSSDQMAALSSEIFRQSMAAKANMGQLPIIDANIDNTSKFLSQVGDYTYALSRKMTENQPITQEEYNQLRSLADYCETLEISLSIIQDQIYSGQISFGNLEKSSGMTNQQVSFVSNIENVEKEFQDYPMLMYDGPFSEHIEKMEAKLAPPGKDIGIEAAKQIAIDFVGNARAQHLRYTGEENGNISCYTFNMTPDQNNKNRNINLSVTKSGYVLMMMDNRDVGQESINMEAATKKAEEFMASKGYKNMKQSYYEKYSNVATINFAYVQDGIIIYPDLVKIKVALDSGEIVGIESRGYIMAHEDNRELPSAKVSEAQAKEKVNKNLYIKSVNMALIATDSYREVLCYEFLGSFDDKNFIVYINAQTGREEKILMLIESESGTLSI